MSPPYRLHLLGGLYLSRDGVIMEGPSTHRKPLALLAMLAVAGDIGVSRDRAAGYLWGEACDHRAKSQLKQALCQFRKSIGDPELIAGVATLRMNPAVCGSDYADLRVALEECRAEDVLALYRGPLLDGVYLDDNVVFQQWVESEQTRMANRIQVVVRKEAGELEMLGKYTEAVGLWSALVEQEPFSDINELGFLRSLVAAGDRAAALRHGTAYIARVRRELEVEPSPEIARLLRGLRAPV